MTARLLAKSALALFALALVATTVGIVDASPAQARVFVGFGFGPFWGYPYPYAYPYAYGYPGPYYPPPVYDGAPIAPDYAPASPAAAPPTWYYCDSPAGYYPYIQQCNLGWRPVAATPPRQ